MPISKQGFIMNSIIKYLMYKDIPVARIQGFDVDIIHYERLPFDLRTEGLDFDMIFHGWTEMRIMNIGRTNAKSITAALGISQNNTYAYGKLLHFTQFTDCYWIKDENERLGWKDVNQYDNSLMEQISRVSLTGEAANLKNLVMTNHLHSPELGAQGLTAKCLRKEADGLYMYKVSRKEIAASQILEELEIPHVSYVKADSEALRDIATEERLERIEKDGEIISKCKIISDEYRSILPWESFCTFCDLNNKDPYEELEKYPNSNEFHMMNIADYIIGNSDRHIGNWGFFVDNELNAIEGLHPLMDHDHAFSDENLKCQTTNNEITLERAAIGAIRRLGLDPGSLLAKIKTKPDYITRKEWEGVLKRCGHLKETFYCKMPSK